MRRVLALTMLFALPCVASGRQLSVLHIKVALLDVAQHLTPVPRHVLLISDNPSSAPPRRILTAMDGTVDVKVRPGSYTVESDKAVAFEGKSYEWTQIVAVVAGRDAVLALTAGNAEIGSASAAAEPMETDPTMLLQPWQNSVVALWTPTTRASGFVIDAKGLIATNQRAVGTATAVEVQVTPTVKVTGRVLVADAARDVAILWVDPGVLAAVTPVPLGCGRSTRPPLVEGQAIFTIESPMRERTSLTSGEIRRVDASTTLADFLLAEGGVGGPVFAADGAVLGLTTEVDERETGPRERVRVVRVGEVCAAVAAAEPKMAGAGPPGGTRLPVEPARPFPADALARAALRGAAIPSSYTTSSSSFDIAVITPVLIRGAQQTSGVLADFSHWSAYVADAPAVLLIRATPKLVEGFWTTVARGAAMTQGIAVPSIKHFKSGFSRMRAFCGPAEVTPIHPFTLEHRISENQVINEGLYAFEPGALGPECGTVTLMLYSEKAPEKGEELVIAPTMIQQAWQDFAPYRAAQ